MTEPEDPINGWYTAYCWVGVGVGAAMVLGARPFLRAYNFTDHSPQSLHLLRLAGTRTATLGAVGLATTTPEARGRGLTAVLAWQSTDTLLSVFSDRSFTPLARALSTLTSAASAAGAAVLLHRLATPQPRPGRAHVMG